jgi:hypothetical protein
MIKLACDDIVGVDSFASERQNCRCRFRPIPSIYAGNEIHVRNDLIDVKLEPPRFKQLVHRRSTGSRGLEWIHLVLGAVLHVDDRKRIQKGHQLAASQNELVDCVLRLVRNSLGIDDQKDFDIIINFVDFHLELFDVEIAFQLADEYPRLLAPWLPHPHHHRIEFSKDLQ